MSDPAADPVYSLISTVETDVVLGDDDFTIRVELLQMDQDGHQFRARMWRTERYRIQSTFPKEFQSDRPAHAPSDELILVDWSMYIGRKYDTFRAENADQAIKAVLADIRSAVHRIRGD